MRSFKILLFLFISYMALKPAFSQEKDVYAPCQEIPHLIQNYTVDRNSVMRFYYVGMSPERRSRLTSLANQYLESLSKVNFDGLPQECKVDYLLLSRNLNENLRLYKREETEYNKLKPWFAFADVIYDVDKNRRRGAKIDAKKTALAWNALIKQIDSSAVRLAASKQVFSTGEILTIEETISGLKTGLKSIFDFYNGYDPLFTWWMGVPHKQLDSTLSVYSARFAARLPKADKNGIIAREPVGREELIKLFTHEMIPYTPEEINAIAEKEMKWCDAEMIKASRELGFGNDWKKALEHVKNLYAEPGGQPGEILRLYTESIDFIEKNDLITIPPLAHETWGMMMMTPERQRFTAFFTGGREISISYPTNTMDIDQRMMSMRGNNPYFSRATVHHELIPGHNLQFFISDRHRTYRSAFATPFWMEGWALYWELLLWDKGFPKSPEEKLGMLFWRKHRCGRIIFSLNYQLGKWTPQQCIDYLVDQVGHERANAESEIRGPLNARRRADPLYQISYLLGGIQLDRLKRETVDKNLMTFKEFHDRIIRLNSMPVEMIRAIMTKQDLKQNFRTKWRFYD